MSVDPKPDEEVLRDGMRVLFEGLGIVNAIRFIQLVRPGTGDYTAERQHNWARRTVDELLQTLSAPEAAEEATPVGR
jgi:hypothetical protein